MTPEETLDWLAQQHFDQCREERPIQDWIRKMKSQLPVQPAAVVEPHMSEQHKQSTTCGEPLEYWNAVEGWVKIDEVREHFDSVGCATIYKTAGEGRVPLSLCKAQPEQEPVAVAHMAIRTLRLGMKHQPREKIDAFVQAICDLEVFAEKYTTPPPVTESHKQEPVAWLQIGVGPLHEGDVIARTTKPKEWNPEWWKFEPLYTTPPQRKPLDKEPEQEPVGVFQEDDYIGYVRLVPHQQAVLKNGDKLYTTPPPVTESHKRKPLSGYINGAGINANDSPHIVVEKLERAIEAAHGIRTTDFKEKKNGSW